MLRPDNIRNLKLLRIGKLHRRHAECMAKAKTFFAGFGNVALAGWTVLHSAAFEGQEQLARCALGSESCETNALATDAGYSVLHIAALAGHSNVARLLLQSERVDRSLEDFSAKKGMNPLQLPRMLPWATVHFMDLPFRFGGVYF
eukprot:6485146-Amphidinium_carterae.1